MPPYEVLVTEGEGATRSLLLPPPLAFAAGVGSGAVDVSTASDISGLLLLVSLAASRDFFLANSYATDDCQPAAGNTIEFLNLTKACAVRWLT